MSNTTDLDKRIVTLTLTDACNLACVYCYEHNRTSKSMSFEKAKQIIDYEFSVDDRRGIEFDMFGGEPFIEFELIKRIDEYLVTNYPDRRWLLFASTNGTLVHGEIQDWLRKRPYFYCGLSLDGTKYMQDINRSCSFDKIDIDFFKELYPKQGIKMTVSDLSLPHLAEGVIYLHRLGFNVDCNLAYGIDWSKDDNRKIIEEQLKRLIDFYIKNPYTKPCKMLSYDISSVMLCIENAPQEVRRWCGVGNGMNTYDVDGDGYPCQFFMPLSVGEKRAKESKMLNFVDMIPCHRLDEKCRSCPYVMACPTCYGSNYYANGDIYQKADDYCNLMKIIFKACAYFKAEQWANKQLDLSKEEEVLLLRSIQTIQNP